MRQKYLNSMKNIIILLLGVTLLFSVLGTFNLLPDVEGMDNDAPACYSTLQDYSDDSAEYKDDLWNNDNYILKTKIVPPKTTPCPTSISPSASEYLKQTVSESTSSSSSSDVNDSYTLNSSASTVSPASASTVSPASASTVFPASASTIVPAPSPSSPTASTGALAPSDYSLNPTIDSTKKNDSCPPCPACERCPEPSFDCKKVPNYRSSSIGQYLPLPILTDFSKF